MQIPFERKLSSVSNFLPSHLALSKAAVVQSQFCGNAGELAWAGAGNGQESLDLAPEGNYS